GITPKTNLFIFMGIFALLEFIWRRRFNATAAQGEAPNKVLLLGDTDTIREIEAVVRGNPQLGYEIKSCLMGDPTELSHETLHGLIREHAINVLGIPAH